MDGTIDGAWRMVRSHAYGDRRRQISQLRSVTSGSNGASPSGGFHVRTTQDGEHSLLVVWFECLLIGSSRAGADTKGKLPNFGAAFLVAFALVGLLTGLLAKSQ